MHPSSPVTHLNRNFRGSLRLASPSCSPPSNGPIPSSFHPAVMEINPFTHNTDYNTDCHADYNAHNTHKTQNTLNTRKVDQKPPLPSHPSSTRRPSILRFDEDDENCAPNPSNLHLAPTTDHTSHSREVAHTSEAKCSAASSLAGAIDASATSPHHDSKLMGNIQPHLQHQSPAMTKALMIQKRSRLALTQRSRSFSGLAYTSSSMLSSSSSPLMNAIDAQGTGSKRNAPSPLANFNSGSLVHENANEGDKESDECMNQDAGDMCYSAQQTNYRIESNSALNYGQHSSHEHGLQFQLSEESQQSSLTSGLGASQSIATRRDSRRLVMDEHSISTSPTELHFRGQAIQPFRQQSNTQKTVAVNTLRPSLVPFDSVPYSNPGTPTIFSPLSCPRSLGAFENGDGYFDADVEEGLPTITDSACSDLKCVSSETVARVVKGEFVGLYKDFILVDCRYPYEYDGGHVKGAVNIPSLDKLSPFFFASQPSFSQDTCIIFYCEFSSFRGPRSYRELRKFDRKQNEIRYPALFYPNVYLMAGGYRKFYAAHKDCCDPEAYIEMNDPQYNAELKLFTNSRRNSEKRSRSYSELIKRDIPSSPS
eukprot:TRINITY_DN9411_c0_g1_i1.p1 TRINITY_DN9411_c0_g1~~TRINITY_DN9411_c0_g1_i1.p1  ORF type:complete len:594 (-),score=119.41 TRINITY_DN9411_c0_g1_i1:318-2099(-)